MKNLLFITGFIFLSISMLSAQTVDSLSLKKIKAPTSVNFQKGKSQLGLQGLSFGYGYGRIIGSVGLRYGYFIADNNMLFLSGEFSTFGAKYHGHHVIKTGIHYRHYFSDWEVKPFAQVGASIGFEEFYNEKRRFGEINLGVGASYNVKRFSFEMGVQLNVGNNIKFAPLVGVSYRF